MIVSMETTIVLTEAERMELNPGGQPVATGAQMMRAEPGD